MSTRFGIILAAALLAAASPGAPDAPPLAGYRIELLELAAESAGAIPSEPHVKDRCRAQEAVAAAWLELDQPERAQAQFDRIENWRRGAGCADLAAYWARHGRPDEARLLLRRAAEIAAGVEDWRRDSVRVKIAQAYTWLGQDDEAVEFESGVVPSESGKVDGVRAAAGDDASFDGIVAALDRLIALGSFDITRNALDSYASLFERFYGDAGRRSVAEQRIKASWANLPGLIRIDVLLKLAVIALGHADPATALVLVNEAQQVFDGAAWSVEQRVKVAGRIAGVRARAGDRGKARADADAAIAVFAAERSQIISIDRAGALRPLAEAYQAMGDAPAALDIYRRAVEEGVRNPNSRPRALDLSATCRSMAVHGVEPDEALWARLRRIREELGPPW